MQLTFSNPVLYLINFGLTKKGQKSNLYQNLQVAEQAYKVAQDDQKITEQKAKIWEAKEKLKILEGHIENLNKLINTGEGNITRMRAQIERKQTIIDQMNKKLEQLVSTSGKLEMSNRTNIMENQSKRTILIFWQPGQFYFGNCSPGHFRLYM